MGLNEYNEPALLGKDIPGIKRIYNGFEKAGHAVDLIKPSFVSSEQTFHEYRKQVPIRFINAHD